MKKTWLFLGCLGVLTVLLATVSVPGSTSEKAANQSEPASMVVRDLPQPEKPGPSAAKPQKRGLVADYGKLPLPFIENRGQLAEEVKYYTRGRGKAVFFTPEEIVFSLQDFPLSMTRDRAPLHRNNPPAALESRRSAVARLSPVRVNKEVEIVPLDPLEGKVNYLTGNDPRNWRTDIPTYAAVLYREAFPGIDLKFYGARRLLEYDIIVKPGADPRRAQFAYSGVRKLALTKEGDLRVILPEGLEISQKKPVVYQEINGRRVARQGKFILGQKKGDSFTYGFEVAAYDQRHPLVIDPPVLIYSSYLGGSGGPNLPVGATAFDGGNGIAADANGNAYVVGTTAANSFPVKNAFQPSRKGDFDCFVTKINAAGTVVVYSTYLGGNHDESGFAIAVDAAGSAYITGKTNSTDFPLKNAFQNAKKGEWDAFVTKLSADGKDLVYSTYLGGSGLEAGCGIAVDGAGSAYVSGVTIDEGTFNISASIITYTTDFPLKNALQPMIGHRFLSFPPSYGNLDSQQHDAFVSKFSPDGQTLIYSTFLGGEAYEENPRIAVDNAGNAYVAGVTTSIKFPVKNFYQGTIKGTWKTPQGETWGRDLFLTKINAAGSDKVYSTYLGGTNSEYFEGIAIDNIGGVYLTGWTISADFPTNNAIQSLPKGNDDGFVTRFRENLVGTAQFPQLDYSTYLGGKNPDYCYAIAADDKGNAYVTGKTASNLSFPVYDPLQGTGKGLCDIFVAMINPLGKFIYSTQLGGGDVDGGRGIAVDKKSNVYVTGETSSTNFPTKVPFQPTKKEGIDAFVLKIAPKIQQDGLKAFFTLDGDAKDVSGNDRHGRVRLARKIKRGLEGGCYYFYQTGSYIQAPVYINPDEYPRLTIGAWVRVPEQVLAEPAVRMVLSCDNGGFDRGFGLDYRGGTYGWSAFCGNKAVLGALPVTPGKWTFVAVVYNQLAGRGQGTVRLHVDNQVLTGQGILGKGLNYIHIGANPTYGEYFEGHIDNVFIFDWALSPKQINYIRRNRASGVLSLPRPE
ncbi:MAG: hypothetical protein C4567_04220 [Deltaproteobacteria bacterium]|nr:MAG: hypothetical protein C4567_04220 [Deltaproteobacteria bacterium]